MNYERLGAGVQYNNMYTYTYILSQYQWPLYNTKRYENVRAAYNKPYIIQRREINDFVRARSRLI